MVALCILVSCAATLYIHNIRIEDASDGARALPVRTLAAPRHC